MKKILVIISAFTILLTGCGSDDASADLVELTEPVEIQFWHAFTGAIDEEIMRQTDNFEQQNEYVTVETVNQGAYNDLNMKLISAKDSDSLPTISVAYSSWDELSGEVQALNDYFATPGYELDSTNFVDSYIQEVTTEDGTIYGIPYNKSTEVVYYNKDLFEEAGITEFPTTLEETFETAKIITEETGVVGIGFDSLANFLVTSMASNGVQWYNEETGEFQFDDPAVVADVQMYQTAIEEGYARTPGEDVYLSGPFGSEQVAMYVGSTAGSSYVEEAVNGSFEWGAFPYPSSSVMQQGTNIVIYQSASPEEKMAAWQYITFLMSDENVVDFSIATGYLPVTKSALESEEYQAHMETDEVAQAAYDQVDKMVVGVPQKPGANQIYSDNIYTTMSKILDNGEPVEESLQQLNQEAKEIIERQQ